VYIAYEGSRLTGACSIYRAFPTPSIVISTGTAETKRALIEKALGQVSGDFISLCSPEDAHLFEKYASSLGRHHEQQMVASSTRSPSELCFGVSRVKKCDLELLNRFYVDHHSEAWAPIQFEAGPYYCIKQDGKVVSVAGVHLVTPQIAQLGNIVTDEGYRGRGFATACTSALAVALASKGRIVSLFVRTDNLPAIHMYEGLGFVKKRDIAFLVMRKHSG
jgi:ribosomal protein S18 acetylase RimI-like enzyme